MGDRLWYLMMTIEESIGRVRRRDHLWIEAVAEYHSDGVDVILGNDASTRVDNVPYETLTVVRVR